jgi:hypothetical protein
MLRLIRHGRLKKWFSYGQEAVSAGCAWASRREDYILPTRRNVRMWARAAQHGYHVKKGTVGLRPGQATRE